MPQASGEERVLITCECGQKLRIRQSLIDSQLPLAKCPKCGTELTASRENSSRNQSEIHQSRSIQKNNSWAWNQSRRSWAVITFALFTIAFVSAIYAFANSGKGINSKELSALKKKNEQLTEEIRSLMLEKAKANTDRYLIEQKLKDLSSPRSLNITREKVMNLFAARYGTVFEDSSGNDPGSIQFMSKNGPSNLIIWGPADAITKVNIIGSIQSNDALEDTFKALITFIELTMPNWPKEDRDAWLLHVGKVGSPSFGYYATHDGVRIECSVSEVQEIRMNIFTIYPTPF